MITRTRVSLVARTTLALVLAVVFGRLAVPAQAADDLLVRPAKQPAFVPVPVPAEELLRGTREGFELLAEVTLARIAAAYEADPTGLVVLEVADARFAWDDAGNRGVLEGYEIPREAGARFERNLANFLGACLDRARERFDGIGLSVYGLPLETTTSRSTRVAEANRAYADVIARFDALVSPKTLITTGSSIDEVQALRRTLEQTFTYLDGRPLMYRSNGLWRIAQEAGFDDAYADPALAVEPEAETGTTPASPPNVGDPFETGPEGEPTGDGVISSASTDSSPSGGGGGGEKQLGFGSGSSGGSGGGSGGGGSGGGGAGSLGGGGGAAPSVQQMLDLNGYIGHAGGRRNGNADHGSGWNGSDQVLEDDPVIVDPDESNNEDDPDDPFLPSGPTLQPGNGWTGPTPQPDPVGNPGDPGYDAKAIARWDVVPFQTFDDTFEIGVVAFHINGIDRVEFSVDNGPWTPVAEMTLNPRTDVWEYWAKLDASDFDDGQIEVRAIAWPEGAGEARVLGGEMHRMGEVNGLPPNGEYSLILHANANGTLPSPVAYVDATGGDDENGDGSEGAPFASIINAARHLQATMGGDAGGGTIYLLPGDHSWVGWQATGREGNVPTVNTGWRWLHITAAPDATRETVRIVGAGDSQGLRTHLVKVSNVTVETSLSTSSMNSTCINPTVWLHDATLTAGDPRDPDDRRIVGTTSWVGGIFATDTLVTQVRNAAIGWGFCRAVVCDQIGADAFREQRFNVNGQARGVGGYGLPEHADVMQWYLNGSGSWDNTIVYNFEATDDIRAQPLFARRMNAPITVDNFALVNVLTHSQSHAGQWQVGGNHILFWNFTSYGQRFLFRDDSAGSNPAIMDNLSIQGCLFDAVDWSATAPEIADLNAAHNHFVTGSTFGAGATSGHPRLVDPEGGDYSPQADSPLVARLDSALVPADSGGNERQSPATIGAVEVGATPSH